MNMQLAMEMLWVSYVVIGRLIKVLHPTDDRAENKDEQFPTPRNAPAKRYAAIEQPVHTSSVLIFFGRSHLNFLHPFSESNPSTRGSPVKAPDFISLRSAVLVGTRTHCA